jgi:hypothetical protein
MPVVVEEPVTLRFECRYATLPAVRAPPVTLSKVKTPRPADDADDLAENHEVARGTSHGRRVIPDIGFGLLQSRHEKNSGIGLLW